MEISGDIECENIFKEIINTMENISNYQERLYADLKENNRNGVIYMSNNYLM